MAAQLPYLLVVLLIVIAILLAWRYYELKKNLLRVTQFIRDPARPLPHSEEIAELVSVIESNRANFNTEVATLRTENERLATVFEQLTDGVLIADEDGRVQFANPAAKKLFNTNNPTQQSVAQVVRSHPLIEAWRRCQQTRQLQMETVELPTRKQYLQIIVIPDKHAGGSLILAQDLTQVRKLETVRRDFISNVSHELRTPLASLKALTETAPKKKKKAKAVEAEKTEEVAS